MTGVADGILWVHELTLVRLLELPRSTYQTWASEGLVIRPASGSFNKPHVIEAVICRAVRADLSVNATRNGMNRLREGALERICDAVRDPGRVASVDLVVNKGDSSFDLCLSTRELTRAVLDPKGPRTSVVSPLGQMLADAMRGFENEANSGAQPAVPKRGRPRKDRSATVIPMRGG